MSGEVIGFLPSYPDVRCDGCRHIYTVALPPPGGLIQGICPKCGHDRFSTTLGRAEYAAEIAEWHLFGSSAGDK